MALSIGQAVPDLSFTVESGETIRLGDLRGKNVVFAFYTRDRGNN